MTLALSLVDDGGARGLADLTLAAVAARAGVAVPSLYKHVASLADLRREVAIRATDDLTGALIAAAIGRSGSDALRATAHAYRTYAVAHPGRYAATQVVPPPGPRGGDVAPGRRGAEDDDARLAEAAARTVAVVAAVLGGCGVDPDRMIDAIRTVRSALHGFVTLELGGGFALPQDVDTSFAYLVRTLEAGLS